MSRRPQPPRATATVLGDAADARLSLPAAVRRPPARLGGSYALCMAAASRPEELYGARRRSPMVQCLEDHSTYVASEALAFSSATRRVVTVQDGELLLVTA